MVLRIKHVVSLGHIATITKWVDQSTKWLTSEHRSNDLTLGEEFRQS